MKVDLLHNKIISETATPKFIRSVNENLTALIGDIYTDAVGILMYEDYINDGFLEAGRWFYPLTVKRRDTTNVVWVSWSYAGEYFSRSPYSYEGDELLEFELAEYVPERFIEAIEGRAHDYDENALTVNVRREGGDPLVLSGRYSQTFIDILASQITERISTALAIDGLTRSDISLELVFAPGSYMEHTSENVTYRRLLMVDGASKPRDFWVKWTNIGGDGAFTVSDSVSADEILFEIGEDVAHKIREKEYRFLCSSDPSVYQSAIGRRAATEWRDLIKRAVRRGEVTKLESELVIKEREADEALRGRLTDILGERETPAVASVDAPEAQGFDGLMDLVRAALEKSEEHASSADGFDFGDGLSGIDLGIGDEPDSVEIGEKSDKDDIFDIAASMGTVSGDSTDVATEEERDEEIAESALDVIEAESGDESAVETDTEASCEDSEETVEAVEEAGIEDEADAADDSAIEAAVDSDDDSDAGEDAVTDGHLSLEELLRRVEESFKEAEEEDVSYQSAAPSVGKITQFTTDNDVNYDAPDEVIETAEEIYDDKSADIEPVSDGEIVADDTASQPLLEDGDIDEAETAPDDVEEILPAEEIELADDKPDEERIRKELEEKIRREYEAEARARADAEIARLIEEATRLREENERLARAARSAEEQHARALSDHIESSERARAAEEMLERERREREREEARERDRLAEAARIAVEERRKREEEERAALEERLAREAEERAIAERRMEEERIAREEAERLERERIEAEEKAREAERIARENEFISKRAKIIFRHAVDVNIITRIRSIVEQTIKDTGKQNVRIHMKAYQEEKDIIVLEVLKMPKSEQELLVSIVKAIGNARMGVTKIILE